MADDAAAARLLCEAVEARVEVVPFAPLRGEQRGDLPGPGGRTPMTWRGVRTVMQLELRQRVRATRRYIRLAIVGLLCSGLRTEPN